MNMNRIGALGASRFGLGEEDRERWRESPHFFSPYPSPSHSHSLSSSPWEEIPILPHLHSLYLPFSDEDPSLSPLFSPSLPSPSLSSPSSPAGQLLHTSDYSHPSLKCSPSLSPSHLPSPLPLTSRSSLPSRLNMIYPPHDPSDPSFSPSSLSPSSFSPSLTPTHFPESPLGGLSLFLPRNNSSDESPHNEYPSNVSSSNVYSSDEFRIFEFKVRRCVRGRSHDWSTCPFLHPGEKARRRDPRKFRYSVEPCPDFKKRGTCAKGDLCDLSHGVFECWLHPVRYRTQMCTEGRGCGRKVCFFAHTKEELRLLPSAIKAKNLSLPAHSPRHSPASVLSPTSSLSPPLTPLFSPSLSPSFSPSQSPPKQPSSPQEHQHFLPSPSPFASSPPSSSPSPSPTSSPSPTPSPSQSSPSFRVSSLGEKGKPIDRFDHFDSMVQIYPHDVPYEEPPDLPKIPSLSPSLSHSLSPSLSHSLCFPHDGFSHSQSERMRDLLGNLQALKMCERGEMGVSSFSPSLSPPNMWVLEREREERVWREREWNVERARRERAAADMAMRSSIVNQRREGVCGEREGFQEWCVREERERERRLMTSVSLPASVRWMEDAVREERVAETEREERVESGREMRAKIYGSSDFDNLDAPDLSWVGDLVESSGNA